VTQQVVARLTDFSMNLGTLKAFVETAEKLGAGVRAKVRYAVDAKGTPCLVLELPERAAEALEKASAPPKPTRVQEAVTGQLEARKRAVRSGVPVPGHVPPVARRGKLLKPGRAAT
jgi:hypothetical protein